MKVGITGARGLVGTALTALLTERGYEVVAFTRNPESPFSGVNEFRQFSPDAVAETNVSGLDVLVHLAGEPVLGIWTQDKKKKIRSSRIESTQGLVKAMQLSKSPPEVFVSASATGYYGDRGEELLMENGESGSGFLAEVTKSWEAAAKEAENLGIRVVSGRIGMVLGKGGGAAPLLRMLFRLCLGGRLGTGKQWLPWVHVEDLAKMFLYVIEQDNFQGAVNFCSPNPIRNSEFTHVIAKQVRRPAIAWVPAPVLRAVLGGMSEMLLFSERVNPAELKAKGFVWQFDELQNAIEEVMGRD